MYGCIIIIDLRPAGALIYPAAERNKPYILECLRQHISPGGAQSTTLLEVGAGTGQHTAHFAPHFPHVTFQPTELEIRLIKSIEAFRSVVKRLRNKFELII